MPIVSTQHIDVAAGCLPTHQLLNVDGKRIPDEELDHYLKDLKEADLADFLRDMVVLRRMDNEATALQRQGQLGLWAPLLGQEAAQIGSVRATEADDFIFPSYREHGVAWARGVKAEDLLSVWRGAQASGWDPNEVNIACQQIVIGSQALHAAGYGMGIKFDGGKQVSVAYFGDGATSQGDVSEAMVFAASYQAPVLFFCQNNQWAISEPVHLQSRTQIADRAHGFGLKTWRVDGNDILAVYAATKAALNHARNGLGPTFIEAVTYRMGSHTTADDPTRYRKSDQLEEWKAKDPIDRLVKYLHEMGADVQSYEQRAQNAADDLAAKLRAAITTMEDPKVEELFTNVYAEKHEPTERAAKNYLDYLADFEGGE
ncbi:pyruvate dehydrogenase (acetyl-transferring) E1 component subunit alpha [Glutamicibacter sp.]|uniref:pyruvate dehydrogenase (acetyl-transferring) E1 component subunit alpha n=1 Tax=Glutamicibacter sp. TaxID=1931995 RepID=UPI003D6C520E